MPDTEANLKDAADGENLEWTDIYARMAKEVREESFTEIARKFEMVAAIEREHEERMIVVCSMWKTVIRMLYAKRFPRMIQ